MDGLISIQVSFLLLLFACAIYACSKRALQLVVISDGYQRDSVRLDVGAGLHADYVARLV